MNFFKTYKRLNAASQQNLFRFFQRFGDPNIIMQQIEALEPFYCNRNIEMGITERFFIQIQKDSINYLETNQINYCYFFNRDWRFGLEVGFVYETYFPGELEPTKNFFHLVLDEKEATRVYNALCKHLNCIDKVKPDENIKISSCVRGTLIFTPQNLYLNADETAVKKIDGKYIITDEDIENHPNYKKIKPITKAVMCRMVEHTGGETTDVSEVDVYLHTGQVIRIELWGGDSFSNTLILYDIVEKIKEKVPYLIYNPNPIYEKIFNKDPKRLLEIAKEEYENRKQSLS